jgi:antitoxin component HigA of HigAB toxin-antitoxin module
METLAAPTIIESKSEYQAALNRAAELAAKGAARTKEESKVFRTWVLFVEEYEHQRKERKLKKLSPPEILKFLMDENGLEQNDFEPHIPQSRISDILNGNRSISNTQAILLGGRFRVKPAIFLGLD